MANSQLKICLAQMDVRWEDKEYNQRTCARMAHEARQKLADFIVFPEMTLTGFSVNNATIVENERDSDTVLFFTNLAKQQKIAIIFGVVFREGRKRKNVAIAVDHRGKIIARYQKIHLFSAGGEHRYFLPGKTASVFRLKNFTIGLAICYDLRFPQLFEAMAKYQSDAVIVIANWPKVRTSHWKTLLQARSLDMQSYIVGVNRVGKGDGAIYNGHSSVYSPWGEKLAEFTREQCVFVVLEKHAVAEARKKVSSLQDKLFLIKAAL